MPALRLPEEPLTDGVVVIREPRESDADAYIAAARDPEVSRWTTVPANYTREHWDEWRQTSAKAADEGTGLHVALFDTGGTPLGSIGLVVVDRDRRYAEIGYWLAREARGKGYMARAVRLLAAWAHEALGIETVELLIDPANEPSRRVARAAGFTEGSVRPGPERCERRPVVPYVSRVP